MKMTNIPSTSIGTSRPSGIVRMISLLRSGPRPLVMRFYDQFTRLRTGAPVWHLSEITPQLFVGGQHYRRGWDAMLTHGITAVVNVREERHNDVVKGIEGDYHLHLATPDNIPPAIEDLRRGVEFIAAQIAHEGRVYVHCRVGVGRAPSLAAAYLITTGLSPEKALAKIKAVRPFIHLTPAQYRQLHVFATSLR